MAERVEIVNETRGNFPMECELADLRDLLHHSDELPGDTPVRFTHHPGDQRGETPAGVTITVYGTNR